MSSLKCKWCHSSVMVHKGPSSRPNWNRWKCNSCSSFGYVKDPDKEELDEAYELAWKNSSSNKETGNTSEITSNSLLNAIRFKSLAYKCLDYGGGKGNFAKTLSDRGCKYITVYEPFGIDPKLSKVRWVNDFAEIGKELFDWIFMIEVVEHLLNPKMELQRIHQHLAPNGKLLITTPNAKGWRARKESFNWREAQNPTHINLFSEKMLEKCILDAGFSSAKRILRPVKYTNNRLESAIVGISQVIGIDGGLRFLAKK